MLRRFRTVRSRVAMSHALLAAVVLVVYIGLTYCFFWWIQTRQPATLLLRQVHGIVPLANPFQFLVVLFVGLPFALLFAAFASSRAAAKALEPLDRMIRMADHLTAKRPEERLPVTNPADESGRLAVAINALMDDDR